MSRYVRCQTETCRRKWHRVSLTPIKAPIIAGRTDLFDVQEAQTIGAPPGTQCPACGGDIEPENGTFEELFTANAANSDDIFDHGRPML